MSKIVCLFALLFAVAQASVVYQYAPVASVPVVGYSHTINHTPLTVVQPQSVLVGGSPVVYSSGVVPASGTYLVGK
ncbi:unnamed protein product [Allacma fusca]|uniref:Uncharacterized protein n=1 Tax=Allacma fusca TaxID=39272 RepID=A0A8J2PLB0_9HEXA|nr:unnamed protein product [Allacma fusca]